MDEWIFVCGLYVLFHDSVIFIFFILLYNYIVMLCLNWTHLCLLQDFTVIVFDTLFKAAIQLRLIFYEHFRKPDDVIFQTFSNDSFADLDIPNPLTLSAIDLVDIKELKVREPLMDLETKAERKTSVASSQCIRITAAARRPQQSAHI